MNPSRRSKQQRFAAKMLGMVYLVRIAGLRKKANAATQAVASRDAELAKVSGAGGALEGVW